MSLALQSSELEHVDHRLPAIAFEEASAALAHLVQEPTFVDAHVVPLLRQVTRASEPYIAHSYGTEEGSTCLQVFVWPAGAMTPIHDHTSWGAYHCVIGSLLEERYERLDDGAQPHTAHLRKLWRRMWSRGDGASTVRPYAGGIHRIANPSSSTAISVHLYGPRTGLLDGRNYDPTRDFVCERLEVSGLAPRPTILLPAGRPGHTPTQAMR